MNRTALTLALVALVGLTAAGIFLYLDQPPIEEQVASHEIDPVDDPPKVEVAPDMGRDPIAESPAPVEPKAGEEPQVAEVSVTVLLPDQAPARGAEIRMVTGTPTTNRTTPSSNRKRISST